MPKPGSVALTRYRPRLDFISALGTSLLEEHRCSRNISALEKVSLPAPNQLGPGNDRLTRMLFAHLG